MLLSRYINGMIIWVVFALMTGAAVLAVLWPLSRRPLRELETGLEARFYCDQLAEIERDVGRGLLSPEEAEGAKTEAGRRLLRASAASPGPGDAVGEPALRRRRAVSAIAFSVVPLLALAVYGAFGSPQIPAQPLSARLDAQLEPVDMAAALARIEAHLAHNSEDGRGWEVVAPVYLRAGRFEDAAKGYREALRLLGESAPRLASYGEALIGVHAGMVTADARAAFERALQLEPAGPKPNFYLAQAAEQDGDVERARAHYAEIVAHSPPEAPWLAPIREKLAALPKDPGFEAVASLGTMDREAAIRGMVEGLAARLEANGGSMDEWSRLVRSYAVLGERDKARTVLERARQSLAQKDPQEDSLDELARELNLSAQARQR
jgi:cytochrome c-type biogenesis protein CcmH